MAHALPPPDSSYGSRTHRFSDASSAAGTCTRKGSRSTKEAPAVGRGEVEAMRRVLNDSIAEAAERFDDERALFGFYCECGDLICKEVVELTVAQYRAGRRRGVLAHRHRAA